MLDKKIPVDVPLYGLTAIQKACYAFLDQAYIRLEGDPAGVVTVIMKGKPDLPEGTLEKAADEFHNELLHQSLRVKVAASNQTIREYIVTRALASAEGAKPAPAAVSNEASVLDDDLEKEIEKLLAEVEKGAGGDPLNIAVPWEGKQEMTQEGKK